MEEKKKYLKPVIEEEDVLIEDICMSSQENSLGIFESEGEDF